MANLSAAKKMIRVTKTRTKRNQKWKNRIKTIVKDIKSDITSNKKVDEKKLSLLYKTVDKATKKNVIHQNKASRIKSNIEKSINKS